MMLVIFNKDHRCLTKLYDWKSNASENHGGNVKKKRYVLPV